MPDNDRKNDETQRRNGGPLPIATLVPKLTRRALGKYGFSYAGLITDWEAIVGAELARNCQPEKISFPSNKRDSGVLRLRAASGAALEIQHLEPQILDRINSYFGYRAVARLQLTNGPVRRAAAASRSDAAAKPAPNDNVTTVGVSDPKLRSALERLGNSVRRRESDGKNR
jgi:hypothetical protein